MLNSDRLFSQLKRLPLKIDEILRELHSWNSLVLNLDNVTIHISEDSVEISEARLGYPTTLQYSNDIWINTHLDADHLILMATTAKKSAKTS